MADTNQIKYTGLSVPGDCSDRERAAEMILDQIILKSDIQIPEEEVERELCAELAGFMQAMRYRAMGGDHQLEEVDLDEWKKEIRREIIRDRQVEVILRTVIEQEKISVSSGELEEAARKLAGKEKTTLEMVRRFMGEDYSLLKKDTLFHKAKDFLVAVNR